MTLLVAGTTWAVAGDALAAVPGRQGMEIEGPMDRRGFYIGAGAGAGVTFFGGREAAGFGRVDLALGGGVTKRFTLGVDVHFEPYFTNPVGFGIGGDIEGTGYVYRGFFLRGALGGLALPKAVDDNHFTAAIGGRAGLGYEFFLNATAAVGLSAEYDLRFVPNRGENHTGLLTIRFTWY